MENYHDKIKKKKTGERNFEMIIGLLQQNKALNYFFLFYDN